MPTTRLRGTTEEVVKKGQGKRCRSSRCRRLPRRIHCQRHHRRWHPHHRQDSTLIPPRHQSTQPRSSQAGAVSCRKNYSHDSNRADTAPTACYLMCSKYPATDGAIHIGCLMLGFLAKIQRPRHFYICRSTVGR